eukprot:CAMPEP_0114155546 /NCGR_PEP_ID=MMETSP0043_2-20121206/25541_1 /TAXON_ID=464988 /ORGANISM="Hemiselmis andersenii, Strain CCMP644" /LENGTH=30 /DNA_ID= /DNA_START= /DNA_END= /DNA_ORIENTATION=
MALSPPPATPPGFVREKHGWSTAQRFICKK